MTRPARDKATALKLLVAALATGVLVLNVLPIFRVGPSSRVPLHVAPFLADTAKKMALTLQTALSKSVGVIDRTSPSAVWVEKITPLLSPQPLPGSRLPTMSGADDKSVAGNSLFLAEVREKIKLEGLQDGDGRTLSEDVRLLNFHYFYLAADGDKKISGMPVRELWVWESTPYVDYADIDRLSDATLRNNVVTALAARGLSFAVFLSSQAPASFYRLSTAMPWISPEPGHIPGAGRAERVMDMNKRNDVTAVYSISPNTSDIFRHRHPVPAWTAPNADFPSGFEAALLPGETGGRRASIRLVTAAQGHFNGILSHEQTVEVPLPDR